MQRIEDLLFPVPTPLMLGNDLMKSTNSHEICIALDYHILVGIFHGYRVVVAFKATQQLRIDPAGLSPASLKR